MTAAPMSHRDVATSIADYLCRTAFSFAGECTWMGTTQDLDEDTNQFDFAFHTLGPDLYGGSSGIALFLAEAWAHTGDERFRHVATEGIAHALQRVGAMPRENAVSVYSGAVGVAYAAARVGTLTGNTELTRQARAVLQSPALAAPDDLFLDIVAGAAGAAPALLLLSAWCNAPELAGQARALGRAMVRGATRGEHGWSWGERASGFDNARDLTGFAHGAAGIGWALLELGRHFGDAEFLHGAAEALRYENAWFQPAHDNWPDFREHDGVDEPAPCQVAWCHGAPGVALSRIRALGVTGDEGYRRDIDAALRTTRAFMGKPAGDWSLCHGRAGLADIMLVAADAGVDPGARGTAMAAADDGAGRYARTPDAWPCGVLRGRNPSLMLGLAGIGYFYLRCAVPEVPSVLCIGAGG